MVFEDLSACRDISSMAHPQWYVPLQRSSWLRACSLSHMLGFYGARTVALANLALHIGAFGTMLGKSGPHGHITRRTSNCLTAARGNKARFRHGIVPLRRHTAQVGSSYSNCIRLGPQCTGKSMDLCQGSETS